MSNSTRGRVEEEQWRLYTEVVKGITTPSTQIGKDRACVSVLCASLFRYVSPRGHNIGLSAVRDDARELIGRIPFRVMACYSISMQTDISTPREANMPQLTYASSLSRSQSRRHADGNTNLLEPDLHSPCTAHLGRLLITTRG